MMTNITVVGDYDLPAQNERKYSDQRFDDEETAMLDITPQTVELHNKKIKEFIKASVLLVATVIVQFLTTGLSYSIGVYYVEFLGVFNKSSGVTSWIGSINFAALCITGPIAGYLIRKMDCDKTIITGGVVSSLGIFSCVFAQNIYMVFISFGLITGVGFGLCFTASLSVINLYFEKWRVFCMGFSLCGTGLGTIVHPFLFTYLISSYGWRGSLLMTSSLTMHVCLAGMIIGLITRERALCTQLENNDKDLNANNKQHNTDLTNYILDESQNEKSMWLIPKYWALHLNCMLYCFGQSVVYTHLASFALGVGFNATECSSFISILGITNLFGRIGLGLLAEHSLISSHVNALFILCYMTAGVWTIFYCLWHRYVTMAANLAFLGISLSAFGPLLSEVVCRTLGPNKFAEGYGRLMLSMAVGTLLGAPSAGWLYDVTKQYNTSFYLGGASFVLSGLIMVIPSIYEKIKGTGNRFVTQNLMNTKLHSHLKDTSIYGSQPLVL